MDAQPVDREQTIATLELSKTDSRLKYFCYAALLISVAFFVAVRIRLRTMPLERDEGEYAYAGQLMLQGIPPYQLAYNMKLPGTYASYALMMGAFGQTVVGIRIGMLVVLLANTLLLFLLTRRLFGLLAATVAAASYTLMANRWSTMSLDGHATHFIVLATLAAILALFKALDSRRKTTLFISGLCFGLAFLMKQHGLLFAIFGFLFWAWSEWRQSSSWKTLASGSVVLGGGIALPYLITCLLLWQAGVFRQFWFWTVSYGAAYENILDVHEGWTWFRTNIPRVPRPSVVWITAILGLTALFWSPTRKYRVFLLIFTLFSMLAVCPGLYFRPHYFLVLLPAVAMLAGIGISASYEYLHRRRLSVMFSWVAVSSFILVCASTLLEVKKVLLPAAAVIGLNTICGPEERQRERPWLLRLQWVPIIVFVTLCVTAVYAQRKFLFHPIHAHRQMHPDDGFLEAMTVGDFVHSRTSSNDRIAVMASEPEIYFYSGRHSATGYIYMYPLTEQQEFAPSMRQNLVHEIEQSRPRIIVLSDHEFRWGCGEPWPDVSPNPDMDVFMWVHGYLDSYYNEVAEVPIFGKASSGCSFLVFQRREAGELISPPMHEKRSDSLH